MPIKKAVEMMWLQPGATVGWTWHCADADAAPGFDSATPPPLYFWFIPLVPGENSEALAVTGGQSECCEDSDGRRWRFKWTLANRSPQQLPLKINIWTPIGASPCAATF